MGIKNKLELLMERAGLNASQLAEKAGLAKSTVYALLKRDSANISYQTAEKLAAALNCSETEILNFDKDETYYNNLKRKIESITKDINELQKDYVEVSFFDEDGNEQVDMEYLNRDEIDLMQEELWNLFEELRQLLRDKGIDEKPYKYAEIINIYNKLNDLGQIEAIKRVDELTQIPKYTKKE